MVVGGGLIAQAFQRYKNNDNILIFASGVSSSKSCSEYDRAREESLLKEAIDSCTDKTLFVYFSSCSIVNTSLANDFYHTHKKNMEKTIKINAKNYTIFRLSNVVGSIVNLDSLFYFLVDRIKFQKEFDLWSRSKRNIIDIDDMAAIVNSIIDNGLFLNKTVNVANLNNVFVDDIVNEISKYLSIDAKYSIIECNDHYNIDTKKIEPIVEKLELDFDSNYLKNIVEKYCDSL